MPNTELLVNKIRTKKHEEPSSINRNLCMKSWDKKNGETRGFICSQSNIILLAHLNIYYFAF